MMSKKLYIYTQDNKTHLGRLIKGANEQTDYKLTTDTTEYRKWHKSPKTNKKELICEESNHVNILQKISSV